MGRIALGLLWGAPPPPILSVANTDEKDDVETLLNRWRATGGKGIHHHWTNGTPGRLLGVWVAIGDNGVGSIPACDATVDIRSIEHTEPYAGYLSRAALLWYVFDKWCQDSDVQFRTPRLYLTPVDESDVSIYT